jgi:DNA-binding NarL/FixJ family response regulator
MGISILLADDHAVVRLGIRTLLEAEPDMQIVAEASNGLEAQGLVERLKPDVLILDLTMPGLNGLDVLQSVRLSSPETCVIVLSMHASPAYVLQALRRGASGYILKQSNLFELAKAVREVRAGREYLCSALTYQGLAEYSRKATTASLDSYQSLTTREREVLLLAAQGLTSAEVAVRLGISLRTAEAHRSRVNEKLGLSNQTDLVRYAVWRDLVPHDP